MHPSSGAKSCCKPPAQPLTAAPLCLRLSHCWGGPEHHTHLTLRLCSLQSMYIFLHTVKGTPFETPDQGKARLLTHWEQMDYGVQFTASRKFLTIMPIVL